MIRPARLLKIFAKRFSQSGTRRPAVRIEGAPDGLVWETLAELCVQHTGAAPKRISYIHVSGWKRAGAYRLFIENAKGREWRVIFKNAIYHLDHIPALEGYPVAPGPPEFLVYANAGGPLAEYLPEVYMCSEVVPGEHYLYLLEDLHPEFMQISDTGRGVKFGVAAELPFFHDALRQWLSGIAPTLLLHYDQKYSESLQFYAGSVFNRLAEMGGSSVASQVRDLWPSISSLHLDAEFQESGRDAPIHGDPNVANVMVHSRHPKRLKFIDWEWAGLGVPYADLVSLFRRVDARTHARLLDIYLGNTKPDQLDRQRRLYQWCRLERGMNDAAYMAAQHMGISGAGQSTLDASTQEFIEKSLGNMLSAYKSLINGQR